MARILITHGVPAAGFSLLEGHDIIMPAPLAAYTIDELGSLIADADAVVAGGKLPGEVIRRARKLKIIANYGAGYDGVDIAAEAGTAVGAAAAGEVYSVYEDETMGMTVVLIHDAGYSTRYSSLSDEVTVSAGDRVEAGQTIGYVGETALLESGIGDHVHFSVSCNEKTVDPLEFLKQD